MRIFNMLMLIPLLFLLAAPAAQASRFKPELWLFEPDSFSTLNYERRYYDQAQNPHINQWDGDDWAPEDWVRDRGSVEAVLHGLFTAGILDDDGDLDGSDPRLDVGARFLRLSEIDQIRVARFVDYAYGISQTQAGGFLLVHAPTCDRIGFYTNGQLQRQ